LAILRGAEYREFTGRRLPVFLFHSPLVSSSPLIVSHPSSVAELAFLGERPPVATWLQSSSRVAFLGVPRAPKRLLGVTKARNRAFSLDAIPLYLQRSRPGTVAGARASGVPACLPLSHSDNVARANGLGRTGRDEATVRGQRLARNKDNSSAHRGRSARVVIALSVTGRARRKP
jgi:hypothetical protein